MASGSAGSIYVDLLLRDANYRQGLNRARQQTTTATQAINSSIKSIAVNFASVFAAGSVFNKFIQNTINAQNEQAQLAAILKSTGNAAGFSAEQLNRMSDALSKDSIFSAGQITNAQTRLLSYSGILGENIPRAMQAVIDQAARLNISVESSAETIGRALEQPSKAAAALSRQGFGSYFTKDVVDMLKALEEQGRTAEAQVKILEVLEESYAGAAKAARDTLGGALINLNNQFNTILTGGEGINAVAPAINALADNIGLVGRAAVIAGTAFAASLVPPLYASATAMTASALAATRLNLAVGSLAFGSTAAAAGMTALSVAATGLTAFITLIGGPVGVAAISAFLLLKDATNSAKDAQVLLNAQFDEFDNKTRSYINASRELRNEIRKDTLDRIEAYQAELSILLKIEQKLRSENFIFREARSLGAYFGLDTTADDVADVYKQLNDEIDKLKNNLIEFDRIDGSGRPKNGIGLTEDQIKERDSLYRKYESIIRGVTQETVNFERVQDDLNKLLALGAINQDEMNAALERYEAELKKTGKEMDQYAKTAAKNIQGAFADFLFDPFEKGLDGMLESFGKTIMRMLAEAQAAQLARALFGNLVEGGEGGGLLGGIARDIFGSFAGGFASGGTIPAGQWGIVGERGPELAFGGNTGQTIIPNGGIGGGISVNIINNNGSSVRTAPGTNGANLDVLIDEAVAKKMGQTGSQINQAMDSYNSRGLVRR